MMLAVYHNAAVFPFIHFNRHMKVLIKTDRKLIGICFFAGHVLGAARVITKILSNGDAQRETVCSTLGDKDSLLWAP